MKSWPLKNFHEEATYRLWWLAAKEIFSMKYHLVT